MHTKDEFEIAYRLFNLLHELADLLFDRYDHDFVTRFMEDEDARYWSEHQEDLERLTAKP